MKILIIPVLAVMLNFLPLNEIQANIVQFDAVSLGPSSSLQIGGVMVSTQDTGQVATVTEYGMGNTMIGPDYSVDSLYHYGSIGDDTFESLYLSVDGVINSITVLPYVKVLDSGEALPLRFEMAYQPLSMVFPWGPVYEMMDTTNLAPVTLDINPYSAHGIYIAPRASWSGSNYFNFGDYLGAHNYDNVTLQYGFSIKAIDYTPVSVPEPSQPLLIGIGLLGVVAALLRRHGLE